MIYSFILSFLILFSNLFPSQEKTVVYLIGDSTCADKEPDAFPEMGWGTPFKTFFNETIQIENRAKNGRSTKSFILEGRWDDVLTTLKEGDYVFIQFGHNDQSVQKAERYTPPEDFKNNLRRFVSETRQKEAFPILMTPVTRRKFQDGVLVDSHEQYGQLTRDIALELNVPMIDMTRKSMKLVSNWGEEQSKLLFLQLGVAEHPNYPNGKIDNTHTNELGARKMARLVLEGIEELELDLMDAVVVGTR